jgi:hypothetical protein
MRPRLLKRSRMRSAWASRTPDSPNADASANGDANGGHPSTSSPGESQSAPLPAAHNADPQSGTSPPSAAAPGSSPAASPSSGVTSANNSTAAPHATSTTPISDPAQAAGGQSTPTPLRTSGTAAGQPAAQTAAPLPPPGGAPPGTKSGTGPAATAAVSPTVASGGRAAPAGRFLGRANGAAEHRPDNRSSRQPCRPSDRKHPARGRRAAMWRYV